MTTKVIKPDFSKADSHWQDELLVTLEINTDKDAVVELPAETVKALLTEFKLIGKKINRPSQVFETSVGSFPFNSDVHYRLECLMNKLNRVGKAYDRFNILNRILIEELPNLVTDGDFLKLNTDHAKRLDKTLRSFIDEDIVGDKEPLNGAVMGIIKNLIYHIGNFNILLNKQRYTSMWDFQLDATIKNAKESGLHG